MATSYTRARRMGRDEEEGVEQLREMLDDPELDLGDLIAAAIEHCPDSKQEELYDAMSHLTMDSRGPRSWARDRLERRRLGRDARARSGRTRFGRDEPEPFPGRPRPGGGMDPIDDRRSAHDMAMDGRITPENYARRVFGPLPEPF